MPNILNQSRKLFSEDGELVVFDIVTRKNESVAPEAGFSLAVCEYRDENEFFQMLRFPKK